jgi:hypothetical protein
MTRLWSLLQVDHDRIWDLLDDITGGSGRPRRGPSEQRRTAKKLVMLQSAHEFAEEAVVWPLVRQHAADGAELVEEGLQQECVLKRALNELYGLAAGTEEFDRCVNTVAAENRTHLSYEQNQVWPRLDHGLDDAALDRAARRWLAVRRSADALRRQHAPDVNAMDAR